MKGALSMKRKLFYNYQIFTGNKPDDFFRGAVLVEGGTIKDVYMESFPFGEELTGVEKIDGGGKILMPGFVNSHTHIYSAFARGMAVSPFSPRNFRELLSQLWWRLDRALTLDDVFYSGLLASVEMIKNGITTFVDHHSSPNAVTGSIDTLAEACVSKAGLRGVFCYETSDRNGEAIREKSLEENFNAFDLKEKYPGRAANLLGLHASFTLEEATLRKASEAAIPIHIHVGEGDEDGRLHVKQFSKSAIERLESHGLLKPDSLLVHCLKIEESDLEIIAENGCTVVFNPQSNMNNGVGIPDFSRFDKNGIRTTLGNDGYGFDLTRDMRTLFLSQHLLKKDPTAFGLGDLYHVVFKNSPEYASSVLDIMTGRIKSGYKADFITYDYNPPTPMNGDNFLGHFYFSIMEDCKPVDTVVDGEWVMKNQKVLTLPEEAVYDKTGEICSKMWERL